MQLACFQGHFFGKRVAIERFNAESLAFVYFFLIHKSSETYAGVVSDVDKCSERRVKLGVCFYIEN